MNMTQGLAAEILKAYSGRRVPRTKLDIYADPSVVGVYAVRWPGVGDFLLVHPSVLSDLSLATAASAVDEVEFTAWPPTTSARPGLLANMTMSVR